MWFPILVSGNDSESFTHFSAKLFVLVINSSKPIQNKIHQSKYIIHKLKWSWRESNPRPNKEQISFLHAYPFIGFRTRHGKRRPKTCLIFKVSSCQRSHDRTIPKLLAVRYQAGIGQIHLRTVSSCALGAGLSQSTLFD